MPFERDPLSVRYDRAAGRRLGEAIAKRDRPRGQRWVYAALPRPAGVGARVVQWLAAHQVTMDAVDEGGLTGWQRAYQRSLFWNAKRLGISQPFTQGSDWCLQVEWGPETPLGRQVAVRLVTRAEAAKYLARKPKRARWDTNPELRSGGIGAGQRRFG